MQRVVPNRKRARGADVLTKVVRTISKQTKKSRSLVVKVARASAVKRGVPMDCRSDLRLCSGNLQYCTRALGQAYNCSHQTASRIWSRVSEFLIEKQLRMVLALTRTRFAKNPTRKTRLAKPDSQKTRLAKNPTRKTRLAKKTTRKTRLAKPDQPKYGPARKRKFILLCLFLRQRST